MSVRKALAAGLFSNAAQYVSTTVESRDKEHTGVDMYHLVRSTGHGQSHISPASHSSHLISFHFISFHFTSPHFISFHFIPYKSGAWSQL